MFVSGDSRNSENEVLKKKITVMKRGCREDVLKVLGVWRFVVFR